MLIFKSLDRKAIAADSVVTAGEVEMELHDGLGEAVGGGAAVGGWKCCNFIGRRFLVATGGIKMSFYATIP